MSMRSKGSFNPFERHHLLLRRACCAQRRKAQDGRIQKLQQARQVMHDVATLSALSSPLSSLLTRGGQPFCFEEPEHDDSWPKCIVPHRAGSSFFSAGELVT